MKDVTGDEMVVGYKVLYAQIKGGGLAFGKIAEISSNLVVIKTDAGRMIERRSHQIIGVALYELLRPN